MSRWSGLKRRDPFLQRLQALRDVFGRHAFTLLRKNCSRSVGRGRPPWGRAVALFECVEFDLAEGVVVDGGGTAIDGAIREIGLVLQPGCGFGGYGLGVRKEEGA